MPVLRVFRYLLKLGCEHFWGDVTIRFKNGVIGHVETRSSHTLDTLPDPDFSDVEYQRLLAEASKGVSFTP